MFTVQKQYTLADYLPEGVEDCIFPRNVTMPQAALSNNTPSAQRYVLGEDEFVQVHLRDRMRKAECECFL